MNISIALTMKELDRYQIMKKLISKHITEEEARIMIGLKSVRQVRRIKKRVLEMGADGVSHKSRGRESNRKISEEEESKIFEIIRDQYPDFKPTFANEKLEEHHNIIIGVETLRQIMIRNKLWKPKKRKGSKERHVWRARKRNRGTMQQFDGSYHRWLEERFGECCLLLSVDDATGEITHAKFDFNEGVHAVFRFWTEYFSKNGFPISIYLDKFSTYKINHPSAVDNTDLMTQFQRAMRQVGVEPINAHSPQAKGRVERMFDTLQDRLVKELRLRGISTTEEANKFLEEEYIEKFNTQFSVLPEEKTDLHKPISKAMKEKLPQIFSIQTERKVQNDYTVQFKNQYFQLEEIQPTTVYKKDTVTIQEHLDGTVHITIREYELQYQILPKKPRKQNISPPALTRKKSGWVPPKDHPWKNTFISQSQNEKIHH